MWQAYRILNILTILIIIIGLSFESKFVPLELLIQEKFSDSVQIIRLANQQKFSIPVNGRYISYDIKQYPQTSNDCTFKQPTVQYKKLAQSNKLFEQDDQVINILVLKKSQKVILADPYFNILVYSTDQHKLLRLLYPKTSLLSHKQQINSKQKKLINSVSMITTQQQDYVYYLSVNNSFVFASKSLGSHIQKLNLKLPMMITKTIYHKGYIVLLSGQEGIFVYRLDKKQHIIQRVQYIRRQHYHEYVDMQFDIHNEIFYFLTQSTLQVYLFKPSQFPNPQSHQFTVLIKHDQIDLGNHTRNHNHQNNFVQNNQHLNLQIATNFKQQNQIFVLFRHNMRQNVIAQFVYDIYKKQTTFLRYFKFQMQIKEIHTIEDVIVVVGNQILGMFPYGIDPRLIKQEFNGWITMSDIEKLVITEAPYFVGITKNSIQFGGLMFSQEVGLSCQFTQKSKTKSIVFSGNLTWCNADIDRFYHKYCSYSKRFMLQSMDIVTTSMVSSSVWIVMLGSIMCIILGILIMLILHKRKQDEIRKLQLYFEQKRRTQIPASSDRRGN